VLIGACSTVVSLEVEGFAECIEPVRLGFLAPVGVLPDTDSVFVVRFVVMLQFYQDERHSPMKI
jgi:hypothetical protein